MALKIRLARGGSKKRPFYRIVVAENTSPRDGKFVERIGSYNPLLTHENPERVVINIERAKHWLSVGAQPTERVEKFLSKVELVAAPEQANRPKKSQPKKKAQERVAAEAAAKEAAAEAAKAAKEEARLAAEAAAQAAAAPAPVEEAPVVEAAVEDVSAPVEEAPAESPAEEAAAPAEEAPAAE
jgi:small subunit ribosomal protein S16